MTHEMGGIPPKVHVHGEAQDMEREYGHRCSQKECANVGVGKK